jgi:hypothetical protein
MNKKLYDLIILAIIYDSSHLAIIGTAKAV